MYKLNIKTWKYNIIAGRRKWSRCSIETKDRCFRQCQSSCLGDASGKSFVEGFAIEKMDVQASHLLGSNARCVLPNDCHQVKQRNLQISNIRIIISLTTFWHHGIPIVDQSLCAMHEELYAMAGSSQCQLADPPHVEAISACGNSFQCKRVDTLSAQKLKYFDRIASFLVVRVLQQVTELYTAMTCTIWMLHIRDFSGQGPGLLARWLGRQVKSSQLKSSQLKSSQVKSSQSLDAVWRAHFGRRRWTKRDNIYKSVFTNRFTLGHAEVVARARKCQPCFFVLCVFHPMPKLFVATEGCDLLIPSVPWPT